MKTLDKSKPYGQVIGASDATAYIQDGIAFDGSFNQILSAGEQQAETTRAEAEALKAQAPTNAHATLLALSVDKIKAELGDMNLEVLRAVREAEAAGTARITLLAALDAEIATKDQLANQLG